jgi:hypothetical protein
MSRDAGATHGAKTPGTNRSESDVKHYKEVSQDIAEDFRALREDVAKLTASVSQLVRSKGPKAPGESFPMARPRRKIGSAV